MDSVSMTANCTKCICLQQDLQDKTYAFNDASRQQDQKFRNRDLGPGDIDGPVADARAQMESARASLLEHRLVCGASLVDQG